MKSASRSIAMALLTAAWIVLASTPAAAICSINSAGLSVTPLTENMGTYVPPDAPSAQAATFTVAGTYNNLITSGPCTVALSFNRASLPASMARTGGGATLPYTIQAAAGGGNTILYTGGGNPAQSNRLEISFAGGILDVNKPFSVAFTVYFLASPAMPQREGNYADAPTVNIFDISTLGIVTNLATLAFSVDAAVAKACTIGGLSTPSADAVTIPVSAAGVVTTAPITRTYANAVCNALSNLQLTSQNGAVKGTAAATGGFANAINYTASATLSGATSALDTATVAGAAGPEGGSVGTTSAPTSSGTLSVTIVPQATIQPLLAGGYSDTLRVTISPQ